MNKLDVALRLLQLLNERKAIDSKTVAHELDVSLRTAQRYLMELSVLPCVANDSNSHSYYLNADYKLNRALVNSCSAERNAPERRDPVKRHYLGRSMCMVCGNINAEPDDRTRTALLSGPAKASNIAKIDKLASIISRRLRKGRCSYP